MDSGNRETGRSIPLGKSEILASLFGRNPLDIFRIPDQETIALEQLREQSVHREQPFEHSVDILVQAVRSRYGLREVQKSYVALGQAKRLDEERLVPFLMRVAPHRAHTRAAHE